jgi:hypothetical protein
MEINRHNYEAYLLDLLEGRLSVDEQQQVHNFLLLNPDCGEELTEIEPWVLEGEEVCFQNSKLLKKEFPNSSTIMTDHNFDLFSIARLEGDLTIEQEADYQSMLELDDLNAQQWDEWQRTRLVPEPLLFQGKDRLLHKRESKSRVIWISVISAAAAVALLVILFGTGTELPQQDSYVQTPQELIPEQTIEVPVQAETQTALVEPEENLKVQATADPPVQKLKEPVHSSIGKVLDRPLLDDSKGDVVPPDDLQPRQIAFSAKKLNATSLASTAVPDQIEPLLVPPVPIHLRSLSVAQISALDLQEMVEDYAEEKDFSLWKIADAGIKGINKLAGSDISLLASRDEDGEVSGFKLKSKRFSLSRPIGQEE